MSSLPAVMLIAEFDKSLAICDSDVSYLADQLSSKGFQVSVASWESIGKNGIAAEILCRNTKTLLRGCRINDLADLAVFLQLGSISQKQRQFVEFLSQLDQIQIATVNKLQVIKENLSKHYLLELQDKCFPISPLRAIFAFSDIEQNWKQAQTGTADYVLKPLLFGEQGKEVFRLSRIRYAELKEKLSAGRGYLIQDYINEIIDGERSIFFVGGIFSHAVLKKFQNNFKAGTDCSGRTVTPYLPADAELQLADRVFKWRPQGIDIMRIDLVGNRCNPIIMELELINPDLYLGSFKQPTAFPELLCKHLIKNYSRRNHYEDCRV